MFDLEAVTHNCFIFQVKKSLSILIHHNLVTFGKNKNHITEFHLELDRVLNRKRFQKYVYCAKLKFGDVAELVVESLLLNGCDILSRVAKRVADRLEVDEESEPDATLVVQKCQELILAHFLIRVEDPNLTEEAVVSQEGQDLFALPEGLLIKFCGN